MRERGGARRTAGGARRGPPRVALLLLLLGVLLAHAPGIPAAGAGGVFLQTGVDAARTGASPDPGPPWGDVAWTTSLGPGDPRALVVLPGRVVVALAPEAGGLLVEVGLDDASPRALARLDRAPHALVSDGERLLVVRNGGVDALGLDGGPLWSTEIPDAGVGGTGTFCTPPAVRDGKVYLACSRQDADGTNLVVSVLNVRDGSVVWTWTRDAAAEAQQATVAGVPPGGPGALNARAWGLSVVGPYVVATSQDGAFATVTSGGTRAQQWQYWFSVWVLSEPDGALVWGNRSAPGHFTRTSGAPGSQTLLSDYVSIATTLTGTANALYTKRDNHLVAVNPARGTELWRAPVGAGDVSVDVDSGGFALDGAGLYVATFQSIDRFDVATRARTWSVTLDPTSKRAWDLQPLTVAGGRLLAVSTSGGGDGAALHAFDAATGTPLWTWTATARAARLAVAGETAAVLGADGNLTILGRTGASPTASASVRTTYPGVGETVRADLSRSGAGLQGAPTRYRADWGDGTVTDWQASPVLEHAYAEAGTRTGRFTVANDAGQTATTPLEFHVGAEEPTFLSVAFNAENQERSFFLLGLAITGIGGAVGVARLRRRRAALQRELAAIDAAFARTRTNAVECEAALTERRASARGKLLDGQLDAAQLAVIEAQVDERLREVRLATLDERFWFLPHGLVVRLQAMLADGRLNPWEREAFVAALDREPRLTMEERALARDLVEAWARRDRPK